MGIEVVPTGAALGAEIRGVDLTKEISAHTFQQVKRAFGEHEVVFFRGRELTDDDHIRFTGRFGEVRKMNSLRGHEFQRPEIVVVSNIVESGKHIGSYSSGRFWHTDGAYARHPHIASLLRALEVPEQDGRTLGATAFASMTKAYDALSPSMKKLIEGREAVHSLAMRDKMFSNSAVKQGERDKLHPDIAHPVVRIHSATGRKCLFVTESYTTRILGIPEDESKAILAELTAHCVQPQFVYVHQWRLHDLVMWDNCSTQHKATFDYALPLRRRMHRTTVLGGA